MFLKYRKDAIPGKPLKRKSDSDEQVKERQKKYEEHRPERKLNPKWQEGRQWLKFDIDADVMKCQLCIDIYGTESNKTS